MSNQRKKDGTAICLLCLEMLLATCFVSWLLADKRLSLRLRLEFRFFNLSSTSIRIDSKIQTCVQKSRFPTLPVRSVAVSLKIKLSRLTSNSLVAGDVNDLREHSDILIPVFWPLFSRWICLLIITIYEQPTH